MAINTSHPNEIPSWSRSSLARAINIFQPRVHYFIQEYSRWTSAEEAQRARSRRPRTAHVRASPDDQRLRLAAGGGGAPAHDAFGDKVRIGVRVQGVVVEERPYSRHHTYTCARDCSSPTWRHGRGRRPAGLPRAARVHTPTIATERPTEPRVATATAATFVVGRTTRDTRLTARRQGRSRALARASADTRPPPSQWRSGRARARALPPKPSGPEHRRLHPTAALSPRRSRIRPHKG
ncbi:hypothetical protein EVAR_41928_1 [Eumeta japonica]|uniref:Uncharacterized protein n=1 Tax=Eumeta variegata TaxID=151549 RepID=A0A4C1XJP8_EUMVA|nr:hypothetical protein EVAR_41928_1 [Eumeta japonica]